MLVDDVLMQLANIDSYRTIIACSSELLMWMTCMLRWNSSEVYDYGIYKNIEYRYSYRY